MNDEQSSHPSSALKEAYAELGEYAAGLGDVDRAIAVDRRRRRAAMVGLPLLTVLVVLVTAILVADYRDAPVTASVSMSETPISSFEDWVPLRTNAEGAVELGLAAPPGTMIYRSCGDGAECEVVLVRADGTAFDLADLRPELAATIAEHGLDGATLSREAEWLGVRVGSRYELHNLVTGRVERIEPGPPGTHWEVLSIGGATFDATMAQFRGDEVIKYLYASSSALQWIGYEPPPELSGLIPVSGGLGTVIVEEPIDTSIPADQRERVTVSTSDMLQIVPDDQDDWKHGLSQGGLGRHGAPCDLSFVLDDEETLVGPRGVSRDGTVFAAVDGELAPQAVIIYSGCSERVTDRLDVPRSTATEQWRLLGNMWEENDGYAPPEDVGGIAAEHWQTDAEMKDIVQITFKGQKVMHSVPVGADVLLPEMIGP